MRISKYEPSPEGAQLRAYRIRADLTQNMLGQRMGFTDAMVALVETGALRPNERYIRSASIALELSLAEEQRVLELRAGTWTRPRSPNRTMKNLPPEPEPSRPQFSDAA